MASSLGLLDRVVVTGSAIDTGAPERGLSVSLNVVDGRQLSRDNTSDDVDRVLEALPAIVAKLRARAPAAHGPSGGLRAMRHA